MEEQTQALIAIGASVAANCHPCLTYHVEQGKQLGLVPDDIAEAIEVGAAVNRGAASKTRELAAQLLGAAAAPTETEDACCCS